MKDENLIFAFLVGWWIGSNKSPGKGKPIPVGKPVVTSKVPLVRPGIVAKPKPGVSFPRRPTTIDVTNYGKATK